MLERGLRMMLICEWREVDRLLWYGMWVKGGRRVEEEL